ncbi:MAG TPA: glycosyltransferase [Candidatus Angelobacter sp.]|jgi:glycosyltransferase involved in cell wall biosynthesis
MKSDSLSIPATNFASKKPKLVQILGRFTGGPAGQVGLLHECLGPWFETNLILGGLSPGEHDMSYLLSSGENVVRVEEMGRRISFLSDFRAFWKVYRFLRRERPEIVHTHTAKAGAVGRLAARLAGVPVIVHTYHGHVFHSYFGRAKTRLCLAIERALGLITTQVVAISDSQKRELCGKYRVIAAEKTTVISNGFHFAQFSSQEREAARKQFGIDKDAFVFVWAGRMAPVKDVELLGHVIRKAVSTASKAFFLVVGDGEEKPRLESQIQGCNNVKLLGWWRDMDQIWRTADAAILTSRNEGTPSCLIEAMAAGLPFVATNVGGIQDLAAGALHALANDMGHRANNGFLASRTPEALFHCVEELVNDRDGSRKMGEAGSAFVKTRFPADRLIANIRKLYDKLAGLRSTPKHQPIEGRPNGQTEPTQF